MRKQDIIRLCDARPDCQFTAFNNCTLIDEAFADDMLLVKNFIPAISMEGFEEATDFRRGKGTFAQVERAVEILRGRRLLFGISCCYTSQNVEVIGSEEYFDQMIAWGAKFCWFFTYMPIGREAAPELMVSAEQRAFMYRRHINANGDYEPCAFIHYSDANVRTHTFLEAQQAPLFTACRRGQPWNENHLRPCPLLGSPDALVEAVERSGARSTDLQSPEDVRALAGKCRDAAETWAPVADELWTGAHGDAGVRQIGQGHFYR